MGWNGQAIKTRNYEMIELSWQNAEQGKLLRFNI